MKYILLCCLLLGCVHTVSAQDSLSFNGTLSVSKGDTYKYKLVIGKDASGKWKGYSVLDEHGVNDTRSSVAVQFSKEKASMVFAEKALLSSKSSSAAFCFVGGLLKMDTKKNVVKGFFAGKDAQNKLCGTGNVRFTIPQSAVALMTPDGTKDSVSSGVLTRFKSETFTASGSTVSLQIWDGGVQDHDSLTITLNDKIVLAPFEISSEKRTVSLELQKGNNILRIRALNEGDEKPNSARILLSDQGGQFSLVSFLKENEEARVVIKY